MQIDELCTTVRSLCNIVAFIQVGIAKLVQDETSEVQTVHNFDDAMHGEPLRYAWQGALPCTPYDVSSPVANRVTMTASRMETDWNI